MLDLIDRQVLLRDIDKYHLSDGKFQHWVEVQPSVQPTICGYNINHLELLAEVLQKENLSPDRVEEALTDIGRIIAIVRDEYEESLRKAVEQCTT